MIDKVVITKSKLDNLARAVSNKSGAALNLTIDQMVTAVNSITTGGGITPTGTIQITSNGTVNVTNYASAEVNVPTGSTINNQDKTVTPSISQQTITADSGYTGLGTVTVNAMSLLTLPTSTAASATSGYTKKATVSRSTSTQYINIDTGYNAVGGYYEISAVANGTAGTPTATKGTVSNNSISITPSVTNTTGYITGGTKNGTAVTVSASELVSGTLSVTSNGTKDVTNYASVNVNVPSEEPNLQAKTYNVSSAGTATVTADSGYDGLSSVEVSVPQANPSNGVVSGEYITQDNQRWFDATPILLFNAGWVSDNEYQFYPTRFNAIPSNTSVTPTESSQTIGGINYMMEGAVTVNAIPSNYVGSDITQRSSTDLTVSGATVTAPAGYYSAAASKSVASGSASAPSSISGTSASVTTGTNTLTLTKTVSVTPVVNAGYVSSGTATNSSVSLTASIPVNPTVTASGATVTIPTGYYTAQTTKSVASGSATGPTSLSGSSATVTTGTNTITLTKTGVTTTPTVSAGYISSATASTATVSLTASVTTKAAATITPTTTNQTIAAGTYLTGAQTIAGDADLVASNIVSGVQIFGVTGSVVLQNYYTGSSAPSSSLGSNGDIYLQT